MHSQAPPSRPPDEAGRRARRLSRAWTRSHQRDLWESICDFWSGARYPILRTARWGLLAAAPFLALGVIVGLLGYLADTTGDSGHTGLLATVTTPVHRYVTSHAVYLPLSTATAYALWKIVGVASFVLAALRVGGGRPLWGLWGVATVAMTWAGTPVTGRGLAAGIALLGWCLASAIALRGTSLRPRVQVLIEAPQRAPEVHADIHVHPVESSLIPHRPRSGGISLN
ncbi:hypothetical protein ACIQU4_27685 [Streptomyces sp. NPDC090741]|uniref:hypothetical protein n=1 Tax=Streptomyces sp. NPDC090741 TaxID=3365967 RepID=UPI00380410B8